MWSTVCDMITFDFEDIENKAPIEDELDEKLDNQEK